MISTTEPESMTAEERRHEIAGILARGLLRRIRLAGTAASPPGTKPRKTQEMALRFPRKRGSVWLRDPPVNGPSVAKL